MTDDVCTKKIKIYKKKIEYYKINKHTTSDKYCDIEEKYTSMGDKYTLILKKYRDIMSIVSISIIDSNIQYNNIFFVDTDINTIINHNSSSKVGIHYFTSTMKTLPTWIISHMQFVKHNIILYPSEIVITPINDNLKIFAMSYPQFKLKDSTIEPLATLFDEFPSHYEYKKYIRNLIIILLESMITEGIEIFVTNIGKSDSAISKLFIEALQSCCLKTGKSYLSSFQKIVLRVKSKDKKML